MGFFRRLFGPKRPNNNNTCSLTAKYKKRWSFVKERSERTTCTPTSNNLHDASTSAAQGWGSSDANKHAIAVAAATAAVAEAALAAAHAAAEVVRLTNGAGAGGNSVQISLPVSVPAHLSRHLAAVKIQSTFRRYLARRALRALKALVKLQALVRGHIVRKQTADMLRRMQTLVRVQARARASRSIMSESPHSSSKLDGPSILKRCSSNSNVRDAISVDRRRLSSCWLDRWMEESVWNNRRDASLRYEQADDEKGDKILEVDTGKPHLGSQRRTRIFQTASDHYNQSFMTFKSPSKHMTKEANLIPSQASPDILSLRSLKYPIGKDEAALRTGENSPQAFAASSRPGSSGRRGDFTPARSECSWGFLNGCADYPNYMANTESFRAKVRSQSAPRQRLEFEKYGFTKKVVQEFWDARTCSDLVFDADLRTEAFLGSTRFNRLGSANRKRDISRSSISIS